MFAAQLAKTVGRGRSGISLLNHVAKNSVATATAPKAIESPEIQFNKVRKL
jgi:hypothetical protein